MERGSRPLTASASSGEAPTLVPYVIHQRFLKHNLPPRDADRCSWSPEARRSAATSGLPGASLSIPTSYRPLSWPLANPEPPLRQLQLLGRSTRIFAGSLWKKTVVSLDHSPWKSLLRTPIPRAGEMACRLRSQAVLPEETLLLPAPVRQLTALCDSSSRGPGTLTQTCT